MFFIKLPNKNKYGIIKILNDIKLAIILFFLSTIPRKNISHAKIIELTGISDHVKLPDIAMLQIIHTIIPVRSVAEKRIGITIFFVMLFLSVFCS